MTDRRIPLAIAAIVLAPIAHAQVTSVDLGNYYLAETHLLSLQNSPKANEASAVTYNRDTGTLFVLEDEGRKIYEVSKSGTVLGSMSMSGFEDTEGLTYVGNSNKFVLAEERISTVYSITYTAGASVARSSLSGIVLGDVNDNIGIEGISYDPVNHNYVFVKEKSPQDTRLTTLNFPASGTTAGSSTSLFNPASLGVDDLSDVQVLAAVNSLVGTLDQDNLLIISQESDSLQKVSRSGTVLGYFNLGILGSNTAEGVTIDDDGFIYIVDEALSSVDPAHLYVLKPNPVPLPAAVWLLAGGLGMVATRIRRRRA